MHRSFRSALVAAALIGFAPAAFATNGYFSHGYGTKQKGMAGAGVAMPLNALGSATNPATLAFVGKRYEIGIGAFNPNRDYTVTGNPSGFPGTFGLTPGTVESESTWFPIPHFGANWMVNDNMTFGVALYGNGGMNTDYPTNTFYGTSPTGQNLSQLFVAPTLAFKLNDRNSIGVTPVLAYQMFKIEGLQAFGLFSSDPTNLTNNDTSSSLGGGIRIGYYGEWSRYLSVGASYQTKMWMGEFEEYAGLFAEQGDFDIPASWTAGIAIKPTDRFTIALDVQQTLYSDIASVGNPLLPNLVQAPLGADGGAGFGWEDVTTFKGGLELKTAGDWAWRAGYSYGEQPIRESEVLFNILAPGVIEQHLTFGFSKIFSGKEITLAVTRAFSKSVVGPNPLEVPGRQSIDLRMDQWDFDVSFAWGF
jgi:long-chain fatty acid transport protein